MITFSAINHTYPKETEQALTDFFPEFGDSAITALVGLNGSGKTALMQILPDLLPSSSEGIPINGMDVRLDDLLGYSVMASSDRDFDNSSAGALVAYASLCPVWDQKLFDHYAQRFGFRMKRRKKLCKVSSGQAVILTGAIVLASGAPVTVLDEIQVPLDMPTRYVLYKELLTLAADCMEGHRPWRIFLISSHMASEFENIAESVVTLENGRLLAHENVDVFTSRICTVTGNAADAEGLLTDHPGTPAISSRTLGSAHETVVDLCDRGITDREITPHLLTLSPHFFQDVLVYFIRKKDQ